MPSRLKPKPRAGADGLPSWARSARSCLTLTAPGRFRLIFCVARGDTLGKALDLLADCHRAYLMAPGHLRRQWNQALFERLVVYDERIGEAKVAEPFAALGQSEAARSAG
jgi:hypothetical protein